MCACVKVEGICQAGDEERLQKNNNLVPKYQLRAIKRFVIFCLWCYAIFDGVAKKFLVA